ncbi:HNH endonuclease family protein [Hyalangium gracile]|uniref:hypothetical protein n=1 Tax=Hyalangium gracile TaxID=394092 RepID=UPI001CCC49A6|nr:hypothetical protein [Hyalangium gracile]
MYLSRIQIENIRGFRSGDLGIELDMRRPDGRYAGWTVIAGRNMYCEDSAGTDIEHFWPKSEYPEKAFSWTNYLLACSGCNSNHKREKFPRDEAGAPLLIDPTVEDPRTHLALSLRTGEYVARTPKGEQSIAVFGLHRDILEKGRRDAWIRIPAMLRHYDEACEEGDWRRALEVQRTICRSPFASVFARFIEVATGASAATFIKAEMLDLLDKYADIKTWL